MHISFHGAAGEVTGSCHLVEANGRKILIDCGLFQGAREAEEENGEEFGFDPRDIDILLLTHAHLDHCGRIPLLRKRGFDGEIITTKPTRELARIVLLDSAHIQEEEYQRKLRHHHRHDGRDEPRLLYGILEANHSFDCFGRCVGYGEEIEIGPGIHATFHDAGHILGSAWIRLTVEEEGLRRSLVFSGDLGSAGRPLLRDPERPAKADILVTETTYGDRNHKDLAGSLDEFYAAIVETHARGGNCIIPTFALDRAQELLYFLAEGERDGKIPGGLSVFLDSPMAITATQIYRRYPDFYREEVREVFEHGHDPFHPSGLVMTRDTAESMKLNTVRGAIILAGSGMCTGGRVRHHLVHNISRDDASIIFVGFAAKGTLAREIVDGRKTVHIFGEAHRVRASVHTINGFSAHADRMELETWRKDVKPGDTFLVHGERETMKSVAESMKARRVHIPHKHQRYAI